MALSDEQQLDQLLAQELKNLDVRYGPERARLRSQMIASGVDPGSALAGSTMGDLMGSQQQAAERMATGTALQKIDIRRKDAQIAYDRNQAAEAKRSARKAFWGQLIGTVGGTVLSAIPGPGMAASAGLKGFLGRVLGGVGGAVGGQVGGALAGGGMGDEGTAADQDPLTNALMKRYRTMQPLDPSGITFGRKALPKFRGYDPYAYAIGEETGTP